MRSRRGRKNEGVDRRHASWRAQARLALGGLLVMCGCATVGGMPPAGGHRFPQPGEAADSAMSLLVERLQPDRPSPQMATTPVRWSAKTSGGFGERSYAFEIARGMDKGKVVQSGPESRLVWSASEAGAYRIRVAVQDSRGNRAQSAWIPYEIAPPLRLEALAPDRPAPQAARTVPVRWKVRASGGVGILTYLFWTFDGAMEVGEQKGRSSEWEWRPEAAGRFRVIAEVTDSLGNRAESGWTEEYEVAPPLAVEVPVPDRKSPQAARTVMVRWKAHASGGVGSPTYGFLLSDGKKEVEVRKGPSPEWEWHPDAAGRYRVKTIMTDSLGNRAESGWSEEYEIAPPLRVEGFAPDRPAPQAAVTTTIRWTVRASGGVGERTYGFKVKGEGREEEIGKTGTESEWEWTPSEAGVYRLRVVVTDALANRTESGSTEPYRIEPKLEVASLDVSRASPQMAGTSLRWETKATGGVGGKTYEFYLKDPSGRETLTQSGPEPLWEWMPREPGEHQVRVRVTDARGNAAEKAWPSGYNVAPQLEVSSINPEHSPPQSVATLIPWRAAAVGGVGQLTYDFESRRNGGPVRKEQSGPAPTWEWTPRETGRYEIRVLIRDNLGNTVAGRWSEPYEVKPPLIAVLPFENLSASPAPLKEIRASLTERLRKRGLNLLGEEELFSLMAKHRIRYPGGIDRQVSEIFRKDAGVGAVLITSLELYMDQNPPKVAIVSRLASTGTSSTVTWADSAALSGDDAPGFLDLGLVENMKILMPKALDRLADSLASRLLPGERHFPRWRGRGRFRPRGFFRAPGLSRNKSYRIAVLPVVNHSSRKYAGEMLAGVMIEQLMKAGGFEVLEPGTLREVLLRYRIVTPEGASLDTADLLFDQLNVDLILTGKVMDYEDTREPRGAPRVTFFVQVIERQGKDVVWASHSTNLGDEGVFFFDMGKVTTAHALASIMAAEAVHRMRGVGISPADAGRETVENAP
jgi:TolB-like protein